MTWDFLETLIKLSDLTRYYITSQYHLCFRSLITSSIFFFPFSPKEKQKRQKYSAVWEKSVWNPLTLLAEKKSVSSQVQKQKVKVALQVPPYSKEVEISKVPEATRTDPGQAQIHIHPFPHLHPQWMSKDRQESRR